MEPHNTVCPQTFLTAAGNPDPLEARPDVVFPEELRVSIYQKGGGRMACSFMGAMREKISHISMFDASKKVQLVLCNRSESTSCTPAIKSSPLYKIHINEGDREGRGQQETENPEYINIQSPTVKYWSTCMCTPVLY